MAKGIRDIAGYRINGLLHKGANTVIYRATEQSESRSAVYNPGNHNHCNPADRNPWIRSQVSAENHFRYISPEQTGISLQKDCYMI